MDHISHFKSVAFVLRKRIRFYLVLKPFYHQLADISVVLFTEWEIIVIRSNYEKADVSGRS